MLLSPDISYALGQPYCKRDASDLFCMSSFCLVIRILLFHLVFSSFMVTAYWYLVKCDCCSYMRCLCYLLPVFSGMALDIGAGVCDLVTGLWIGWLAVISGSGFYWPWEPYIEAAR